MIAPAAFLASGSDLVPDVSSNNSLFVSLSIFRYSATIVYTYTLSPISYDRMISRGEQFVTSDEARTYA